MMSDHITYFIIVRAVIEDPAIGLGTLWYLEERISHRLLLLAQYEGQCAGILKQIDIVYVKEVTYEMAHLLLAIPEPFTNRISVIEDPEWIQEGLKINIDTVVQIYNYPGIDNGDTGTVKFKGRLPGKNGISFGIELNIKNHGKGTTDGMFRHKRLFTCIEDCGIFVSLLKIRIAYHHNSNKLEQRPKVEGAASSINQYIEHLPINHQDLPDDSTLQLNERIVWMSDDGAEFGTVKWVGILPYSADNRTIVGVEFDNPVGSGTGKYRGQQLFRAKRNHASLIPVLGLLKACVYMSMLGGQHISDEDFSAFHDDVKVQEFSTSSLRTNEEWTDSGYEKSTNKLSKEIDNLKIEYLSPGISEVTDGPTMITRSPKCLQSGSKDISLEKSGLDSCRAHQNTNQQDFSKSSVKPRYITSPWENDVRVEKAKEPQQVKFITMERYKQQRFDVQVDSKVCIDLGIKRYGVVRWMGTFPFSKMPDRIIVGLEMETEDPKCYTDGKFQGEQVFDCPPRKGFFFPLNKCLPDTRHVWQLL